MLQVGQRGPRDLFGGTVCVQDRLELLNQSTNRDRLLTTAPNLGGRWVEQVRMVGGDVVDDDLVANLLLDKAVSPCKDLLVLK